MLWSEILCRPSTHIHNSTLALSGKPFLLPMSAFCYQAAYHSPMGCAAGPGPRPASWKRFWDLLKAAKRPVLPTPVPIVAHICAHHCPLLCTSLPIPRPWDALLAPVLVRHPGNAFGIFSKRLRGQQCPQVYAHVSVILSAHHSSLLFSPTLAITTKSLYLIQPQIDQACITGLRLPYTTFGSVKEVPNLSSNMSFKNTSFKLPLKGSFVTLQDCSTTLHCVACQPRLRQHIL